MASFVVSKVAEEVNSPEVPYIYLKADRTKDCNYTQNISIIVRYFKDGECKENLLDVCSSEGVSEKSIAAKILKTLYNLKIDSSKIISQVLLLCLNANFNTLPKEQQIFKTFLEIALSKRHCSTDRFPGEKLTLKKIEDAVMTAVRSFDEIDPSKLTMDSHFINDLGLDSLDHVEIMLHIEDEFTFEIPDQHAERLMTPRAIIQYVGDVQDVYE